MNNQGEGHGCDMSHHKSDLRKSSKNALPRPAGILRDIQNSKYETTLHPEPRKSCGCTTTGLD
jgi:hypothetical protein